MKKAVVKGLEGVDQWPWARGIAACLSGVMAVPLGGSHPLPAKRQKTTSASSSFLSTAMAHILSSTRSIPVVPVKVWREHICHTANF